MTDEQLDVPDPFRRETVPLVVVITGPSGVGKDTLVQRMKERGCRFHFVVTATDRPPRTNELDGTDYCFYTTPQFEEMIAQGELLEYACVYGQYKGIPKAQLRRALASGKDIIMRVDVQGADTVKRLIPAAVTIFLLCESEEELVARLRERRTESEEAFRRRLETARQEMTLLPRYDYVVVNRHSNVDEAVDDVTAIIRAEHCRATPAPIEL